MKWLLLEVWAAIDTTFLFGIVKAGVSLWRFGDPHDLLFEFSTLQFLLAHTILLLQQLQLEALSYVCLLGFLLHLRFVA